MNNNHSILLVAMSKDGKSFSEKELRDIESYLTDRGFKGRIDRTTLSWLEFAGVKIFG